MIAKKIEEAGHKTDMVHLPSVGALEPLKNFDPDVSAIKPHVKKAVDAGQKVVMVAHSYGGIPTSEAVHGLDYKTRQTNGRQGGVIHLFYCCSFIIEPNQTLHEAFGSKERPWYNIAEDRMTVTPIKPEEIFYNDLPEDEARRVSATLKPQSWQVFESKLNHASWQTIPSTYLYCLQDNAIPMPVQELMVNEFAKGYEIRTETIDASHSPFLSKPDETAAIILKVVDLPI